MIKMKQFIDVGDWDNLVEKTYGRPYSLQQQDGCKDRGIERVFVPISNPEDYDFENDSIPEVINGEEMGVSFKAWLDSDPEKTRVEGENYSWTQRLFWHRNFYPSVDVVANDLYNKGLLPAGELLIHIDW